MKDIISNSLNLSLFIGFTAQAAMLGTSIKQLTIQQKGFRNIYKRIKNLTFHHILLTMKTITCFLINVTTEIIHSASSLFRLNFFRRTLKSETIFGICKPLKNDEKYFLFHLKSSFHSQDI